MKKRGNAQAAMATNIEGEECMWQQRRPRVQGKEESVRERPKPQDREGENEVHACE